MRVSSPVDALLSVVPVTHHLTGYLDISLALEYPLLKAAADERSQYDSKPGILRLENTVMVRQDQPVTDEASWAGNVTSYMQR